MSASARSPVTTHILDTARGCPAAGVEAVLYGEAGDELGRGVTNADGRIGDLLEPGSALAPGNYRLSFAVAAYLDGQGDPGFYPTVEIWFRIVDPSQHYHVPLLLSPFGFSTYRGS